MTLSECSLNSIKTVLTILKSFPHRRRLMEMGLLPGTKIEIINKGIFGFPIEIKIRNYTLALSETESNSIEVE